MLINVYNVILHITEIVTMFVFLALITPTLVGASPFKYGEGNTYSLPCESNDSVTWTFYDNSNGVKDIYKSGVISDVSKFSVWKRSFPFYILDSTVTEDIIVTRWIPGYELTLIDMGKEDEGYYICTSNSTTLMVYQAIYDPRLNGAKRSTTVQPQPQSQLFNLPLGVVLFISILCGIIFGTIMFLLFFFVYCRVKRCMREQRLLTV